MRVVVDTNVIVSTFLSPTGPPALILRKWQQHAFELLVSEPLLQEYQRALGYGKVAARHGMTPPEIAGVIAEVREFALLVEPEEMVEATSEDPDDNRVLECAAAGAADYIVSGDLRHLLRLRQFRGIQILSPGAFLAVLDQEGPGRGE